MKHITLSFITLVFFAGTVFATPPELSRAGSFAVITEEDGKTTFIRSDRVLSLSIRPYSEVTILTITTDELVVQHLSTGQRGPGGVSENKEYEFRFPTRDAAMEFAAKLTSEEENTANKTRDATE